MAIHETKGDIPVTPIGVTKAQRLAMTPSTGLYRGVQVYQTDDRAGLYYWNNSTDGWRTDTVMPMTSSQMLALTGDDLWVGRMVNQGGGGLWYRTPLKWEKLAFGGGLSSMGVSSNFTLNAATGDKSVTHYILHNASTVTRTITIASDWNTPFYAVVGSNGSPTVSLTINFTSTGQGLFVMQTASDNFLFYKDGSKWRYVDQLTWEEGEC